MMTLKRANLALAGLAGLLLAGCGAGDSAPATLTPEQAKLAQAVEARQHNFQDLGAAFKAINDEMKAGRPTSTTVIFSIKSVSQYAGGIGDWFPEGSGPELGVEMEAKADIWERPEEFAEEIAAFRAAVEQLEAASGDAAALPAAFGATGKTCKSCHDKFRLED